MRKQAVSWGVCLALALVPACQQAIPLHPGSHASFSLDRQAVVEHMARPDIIDWSVGRYTTRAADELRHTPPVKVRERQIQALTQQTNFSYAAKVTSAPAWDMGRRKAYFVTDTGMLYRYSITTSGAATLDTCYQVKDTGGTSQTFANTSITLSNDGLRAYLTSLQGNFLVIDTATGACRYSTAIGLNTTFTQPTAGTGVPPSVAVAPFVDPLASRPDGQWETVYAVANSGSSTANSVSLLRFAVSQAAGVATPTVTKADTYSIPVYNTSPYIEGVRVPPIVIGGKALLGAWRKYTTNSNNDVGDVIYYDTKAASFTTASTAGSSPALVSSVPVASPCFAPLAVDVDDSLVPFMAFEPTSDTITAIDLNGSQTAQCTPLLVDHSTPPTIDSTGAAVTPPQSLHNYPYKSTGSQNVDISPVVDGSGNYECLTVSGDATNLHNNSALTDLTSFYSYGDYDGTTPLDPAYGYVKFYFDPAKQIVAGETVPRGVSKVVVRLNCTTDSNPGCCGQTYSSTVPNMDGWIVSNNLSTGSTAWDTTNITPTNRPTFLDGTAFNTPPDTSHSTYNLPPDPANNVGNKFRGGNNYDWIATGLINSGDTKTVGYYNDNDQVGNSSNNGKPHNVGCPFFAGGTSSSRPVLHVTLAGAGLYTPAMTVPVTIDSVNEQVYAVNCNALFRISYQSFTYTGASQYSSLSVPERLASFTNDQMTFYAMTDLGGNSSYGPQFTASTAPTTRYVGNQCAPLLTYDSVYVMDNFMDTAGNYSHTTLRQFTYGTYPTSSAFGTAPAATGTDVDLTATASDAKGPGTYLVFDADSAVLLASTYNPGANQGRGWVLTR